MKYIVWLGPSFGELGAASDSVKRTMGGALRTAQQGGRSADATPMHDDLRNVMEVRDTDEAGTYRLMYTVAIGDELYVLDFFQKKSKSGIATPKADLERIRLRLKKAYEHAASRQRR